jgi:hypothetical protein
MSAFRANLLLQSEFNSIITTKAQAAIAHSHKKVRWYKEDLCWRSATAASRLKKKAQVSAHIWPASVAREQKSQVSLTARG